MIKDTMICYELTIIKSISFIIRGLGFMKVVAVFPDVQEENKNQLLNT